MLQKATTHVHQRWGGGDLSGPEDLDGAPQVEDEEDNRFVLHLFQTAEDNKENDVSPCHLHITEHNKERSQINHTRVQMNSNLNATAYGLDNGDLPTFPTV